MLQAVPEAKRVKNRVHLDLRTRDLDAEVVSLTALGARVVTPAPREEDDWVLLALADPDGNELCVVRPPPRYWEHRRVR